MSGDDQAKRRTNLGRGLDALFGDEEAGYGGLDRLRQTRALPIERLVQNPDQPRRHFDEVELVELVDSIREQGILQPILVRPLPDGSGNYEIVAGERRWRAAQRAKLHEVPVIIRELSDLETLQIAIIENVQRQDLNALEEAMGYRRLIDEFNHSQEDLAKAVGKSRSHIANTLRLLDLPKSVHIYLETGAVTAGHARALLACADPAAAAEKVVAQGLNVRQTEALSREGAPPRPTRRRAGSSTATDGADPAVQQGPPQGSPGGTKDPDTLALENDLSGLLGLKVALAAGRDGSGTLSIHYRTLDQLDDVLQRLSQTPRPAAD
ncbi:MAG: ParB/RepB/Spo0J family partition protein [Inquilinaceae bacterium]